MDPRTELLRPRPGVAEQHATRAAFFIAGFGLAAWAPLVPYAKARLGLQPGLLGLLLLCLGIGAFVTMPLSGVLAARFGCRRLIWLAGVLIGATLPVLATAGSAGLLAGALLVFGAGIGAIDVAINIQAVIVEQAARKPMMSGFHGLFSVGGIAGAGGVSLLLWAGTTPLPATLCVAATILALLLGFGPHLLPYGSQDATPLFVRPRGVVLLIGAFCGILFLAEGAMLDWSGVVLTTLRGMGGSFAGLGYAVFAVVMTVGRLSGDRVVHALGGRRVILFGGLCAAAGLTLVALVPSWIAALAGFGTVGLGASNVVPVLYSALGRQRVMPPNLAVAAVTTMGYAGVLAGPALIGFVAQASSLPVALLCVAVLLLMVAAGARAVIR